MPARWLHFRVKEELYERMREAAATDQRSISNWVVVACERALDASPQASEPTS